MSSFPSWPEWPKAELACDVPAFNGGEVVPAGTPVEILEWVGTQMVAHSMTALSFRVRAPRDPSRVYEDRLVQALGRRAGARIDFPPLVETHVTVEVNPEALRRPTPHSPRLVVSV